MSQFVKASLVAAALPFTGCATLSSDAPVPDTHYQAPVVESASGSHISVAGVADRLDGQDVVVIGEHHGQHASHLLQLELLVALYQRNDELVLTMEQFNIDQQGALDRYLQGEIGESEMIQDTNAWSNYRASYRPLVEFAISKGIPVIAANAPLQLVRCTARQGPQHLEKVEDEYQSFIPEDPFMGTEAYREKFAKSFSAAHEHHSGNEERRDNTYHAQLLRDNTMATSIIAAREAYPDHQVVHLTGSFHSEAWLGTVYSLQQRRPELSLSLISPVFVEQGSATLPIAENRDKGDFLYFTLPLPEKYLDSERELESILRQAQSADKVACSE